MEFKGSFKSLPDDRHLDTDQTSLQVGYQNMNTKTIITRTFTCNNHHSS